MEVSRAEKAVRTSGPGIVICMADSLMVENRGERVVWLPWCGHSEGLMLTESVPLLRLPGVTSPI